MCIYVYICACVYIMCSCVLRSAAIKAAYQRYGEVIKKKHNHQFSCFEKDEVFISRASDTVASPLSMCEFAMAS